MINVGMTPLLSRLCEKRPIMEESHFREESSVMSRSNFFVMPNLPSIRACSTLNILT